MEGLIFDLRSFSVHDGPGLRTTLFMKGCPLRCAWCHNPESFSCMPEKVFRQQKIGDETFTISEMIGRKTTIEEVMQVLLDDRPFFEESGGGLTISGGEPLMQADFVKGLLQRAREYGIHTAIDTSGFASETVFRNVVQQADLVLFDLKIADEKLHTHYTGKSNHLILKNLQWLAKSNIHFFIRIPLIPDVTDTTSNLQNLALLMQKLPHIGQIDLLPFHHFAAGKYERLGVSFPIKTKIPYSKERIKMSRQYFEELDVPIIIGG